MGREWCGDQGVFKQQILLLSANDIKSILSKWVCLLFIQTEHMMQVVNNGVTYTEYTTRDSQVHDIQDIEKWQQKHAWLQSEKNHKISTIGDNLHQQQMYK